MVFERMLLVFLDFLFVLLVGLLPLDNLQESIALVLSLLSVHDLFLQELLPARLLKFSGQHLRPDHLVLLGLPSLPLSFFIGAFRSKSIDLALSVSCTLLEFTKALDLLLLLIS